MRRASIRRQVRIGCPPDVVWEAIGDPARIHEWFPGIVSCTVEGDRRDIVTGAGLTIPEEIVTHDDIERRFQYRITGPLLSEHLGTIDVHDLGDGTSFVVYSTDAAPGTMALIIGGAAGNALHELRRRLEGGDPS